MPQAASEPTVVGHRTDQHAWSKRGWKSCGVGEIPIERDERASEFERTGEVHAIGRAAQVVVFNHEEHVPPQFTPHHTDHRRRHVGVDVHTRRRLEGMGNGPKR